MRSVAGERDLRRNALAVEADPGFPPHHHCRKGVESLKALVSRSGFPGLWEGLLQNWSLGRLHPSGVPRIARCRSDVNCGKKSIQNQEVPSGPAKTDLTFRALGDDQGKDGGGEGETKGNV